MKIKKVTFRNRNDFSADMECEFCSNVQELNSGYEDSFYHNNVIPAMECNKCNKSTKGNNPNENKDES